MESCAATATAAVKRRVLDSRMVLELKGSFGKAGLLFSSLPGSMDDVRNERAVWRALELAVRWEAREDVKQYLSTHTLKFFSSLIFAT